MTVQAVTEASASIQAQETSYERPASYRGRSLKEISEDSWQKGEKKGDFLSVVNRIIDASATVFAAVALGTFMTMTLMGHPIAGMGLGLALGTLSVPFSVGICTSKEVFRLLQG